MLNRREPPQPNQELVEIDAINSHADSYRAQLDKQYREARGERPDPEQAGGWIARYAAKTKAEAWDKGHAQIDRQVEQRKEHLRSDAPDARQFRAHAWTQAEKQYVSERASWTQARSQANAHLERTSSNQTTKPSHTPQGEPQMDRSKQQQQSQQQAQQKQAQEKTIAERQAREAQARQLAEKQQKQKEQKQKDREQARMMDQGMDIDR